MYIVHFWMNLVHLLFWGISERMMTLFCSALCLANLIKPILVDDGIFQWAVSATEAEKYLTLKINHDSVINQKVYTTTFGSPCINLLLSLGLWVNHCNVPWYDQEKIVPEKYTNNNYNETVKLIEYLRVIWITKFVTITMIGDWCTDFADSLINQC